MPILPANHFEWEDSVSFGQQPIRCSQIAVHVNESDGGSRRWLGREVACCGLRLPQPSPDTVDTVESGRRDVRSGSVHNKPGVFPSCG